MGHVYRGLSEQEITPAPEYFPERLIVEECENIHIHFRNHRIELSTGEFIQFAECMADALKQFRDRGEIQKLPIAEVDPYDTFHLKGFEHSDEYHRDGIEKVKELIIQGKPILPILVRIPVGDQKLYKRQDGFKRYFAFKELGHTEIDCYVVENRCLGAQHGMPWIMER